MKQTLRIEELLDLYIKGQLSDKELKDLFDKINKDKEPEHATAWFYKIWDEIQTDHLDRRSVESLRAVKSKLMLSDNVPDLVIPRKQDIRILSVKNFLRYAAVFILAFSAAWYIFGYKKANVVAIKPSVNEIYVPYGSKSHLTLNDGTKIWLNSGSHLRYSEYTNAPAREVYLEGEAFFDVSKKENSPFIVNTSSVRVKVLGTKFNVKSYPSEKTIETTLVTGKVEIEELNPLSHKVKTITLKPNQKATFIKSTNELNLHEKTAPTRYAPLKTSKSPEIIEKVNPVMYTSWKDQKLVFNNERLESLTVKLERWYNVNITLKDTILRDYRYTGKFEKENIEQALKALELATPLKYKIEKNNIEIFVSKRKK